MVRCVVKVAVPIPQKTLINQGFFYPHHHGACPQKPGAKMAIFVKIGAKHLRSNPWLSDGVSDDGKHPSQQIVFALSQRGQER